MRAQRAPWLQQVERQSAQFAQRGVAGAEVIDGDRSRHDLDGAVARFVPRLFREHPHSSIDVRLAQSVAE